MKETKENSKFEIQSQFTFTSNFGSIINFDFGTAPSSSPAFDFRCGRGHKAGPALHFFDPCFMLLAAKSAYHALESSAQWASVVTIAFRCRATRCVKCLGDHGTTACTCNKDTDGPPACAL
ncbi:hypothetical protein EVAR_56712_1 [Eumeta japonica]|uniref:Uncharacterized protein n=1 Tax=Eumeta variegata TaxID=151549 RepID=A0A4C1XZ01_EUMVA|nr:hypothetical protein EVAR_56712_1 [Eumeta japonica]